ncbi:hypothetical protein [Flavobacterium limnophilum]|uniref:hypothetical protein n=1 Tax=Flavobacterium limnophilum TaxID=3003262 RepID=UPI002482A935|nr:hypothetical protein [Flavobacterium limnophilum]
MLFSKNDFTKCEKRLFLIIGVLYLLFFMARMISNIYFLTDSYEYFEVAKAIRDFTYFESSNHPELFTRRPFLYPLFLSFFVDFSPIFIVVIQTVLGLFNTFILFKIIKQYKVQLNNSLLILFLFTPSIFIYSQLIMSEWLVMLFLTMLFWLLLQKWDKNNFAYIQIITVLLAFTKPIFYPFIYVNLVFFLVYMIKKRVFSFWLFLPIICLQLYLNYNKNTTGYKHFSSIENANLIDYNLYYFKSSTQSKEKAELWLDSVYNDKKYVGKSFKEQNIYLKQIATNEIKKNFFQYSFYHFYTAIRGIVDPGRFDLMTFFEKETGRQGFLEILNNDKPIWDAFKNKFVIVYLFLIPVFLANCIKWFYFLKYLFFNKLTFKGYYFIILFGYYILVSGPVNCSRYMMPFQGILIVFAVLGMLSKSKNLNQKTSNC